MPRLVSSRIVLSRNDQSILGGKDEAQFACSSEAVKEYCDTQLPCLAAPHRRRRQLFKQEPRSLRTSRAALHFVLGRLSDDALSTMHL